MNQPFTLLMPEKFKGKADRKNPDRLGIEIENQNDKSKLLREQKYGRAGR